MPSPRSTLRYGALLQGSVLALGLLSMAACATKPKYAAETPTPPQAHAEAPPMRQETPRVAQGPIGPVPGSAQDFVVNVGDRVYFDTDQYNVRDDARPILDGEAAWLGRYPAVHVRIEGNADERGTREYNFALGGRRAEAVRSYLVSRGVAPSRIETISYGKERPIDMGSGEDAWAKNRNGHTALTSGAN